MRPSLLARVWGHAAAGTLGAAVRAYAAARRLERRTQRWEALPADGSLLAPIAPGVTMRLHRRHKLDKHIYLGDFEVAEQAFVRRYLRRGDVFLDIGANSGLFTLLAASARAAVHAFEPARDAFARLQENVSRNRLADVHTANVALSDVTGTARLRASTGEHDAWNSMAARPYGEGETVEEIRTETLDGYTAANGLTAAALIKIDVEGWEMHVVGGGRSFLARPEVRALLVEFSDVTLAQAGSSTAELRRALEALGYGLFSYDPDAHRLRPEPPRDHYRYANLIAARDVGWVESRLGAAR